MSLNTIIQKGTPHFIACIIFLLVSGIYFTAQLQGKVEKSHDIVSARANHQEFKNFLKETGEHTLWTNALFGGMPMYQINSGQPTNLVKYAYGVSRLYIPRPIGMFFSAMLIFYIMLVLIGVNPWLSVVGALAFGLTTNNYVLYGAGHVTKVYSIIHLGLVTAGVLLAFRKKKYLIGGLVFSIGLAMNLLANHVQMTYYFLLTLLLYGVIELVYHIMKKEMESFGKAVLYLGIGGILAVGSSAGKLLTTYEYSKDTMRGDPILTVEGSAQKTSSNTSGLEYGYATNWSNGWLDLVANFIPGVVGGGGLEYWGPNTDGTAGPAYYGAIICFLFIFGMLIVRGPTKWWLVGGVVLISLISLGKNFWLHELMYNTVPLFNKFRTPNSALSVVAFMVPILGILGLNEMFKGNVSKEQAMKALYISAGILLAICLFFGLMGGSFFDFKGAKDALYADRIDFRPIIKKRSEMLTGDSWRSFGLILVAAGLIWAFLKEKIGQSILLVGLGLLIVGDLWTVDKKYLDNDQFVKPSAYKSEIKPRPVDEVILKDTDPNYRVFDISGGTSAAVNSSQVTSKTSYYHKNTGGYHPAKLQRYQDMLDRYIIPEAMQLENALRSPQVTLPDIQRVISGMKVFHMLNNKYFILNENTPIVNENALGNAWFVDSYKFVNSPNEEIDEIRNINPAQVAIVHNEFSNELEGLNIQKNGEISLTDYKPNHLTYVSNSSSDQLAVFSEVWYGPDKGWQAYIDGNAVDHIRVDYILRGLRVPPGQHTIEFKFKPKTYAIGSTVSLICSLIILLGLIGFIWYKYKNMETKTVGAHTEKKMQTSKKLKSTKSKRKGKK